MSVRLYILVSLLLASNIKASEVLSFFPDSNRAQVSQDKQLPWTENDKVCFYRKDKKIACGRISESTAEVAAVEIREQTTAVTAENQKDGKDESFVELTFGKAEIKKGDRVELDNSNESEYLYADSATQQTIEGLRGLQRRPSSLDSFYEEGKEDLLTQIEIPNEDDERTLHHDKISNLTFGLNFIFPTFQYQQAITKKFAVGLTGQFVSTPLSGGNLRGYGGMTTLNFYSLEPFHGTWVQIGMGLFSLTGSTTTSSIDFYAPNILFNTGWRWFWDSGVNFGFAVGVEYFLTSGNSNSIGLDFSGLFPSISLDIGFAF